MATVPRDRVYAPPLTPEQAPCIDGLREAVLTALMHEHGPFYDEYVAEELQRGAQPDQGARAELAQRALQLYARLADDNFLHRYLRARQYDIDKACAKVLRSLAWHLRERPEDLRAADFAEEARFGKVYLGGTDRHGRPVVVLDSSLTSVLDEAGQIRHLVWTLDRAVRRMARTGCEKLVVFMHMESFGFTNFPPLRAMQDAIRVLGGHFPERLGHCVLYMVPYVFGSLWSVVKQLIDPVTREKFVMIAGDTAAGTANDATLTGAPSGTGASAASNRRTAHVGPPTVEGSHAWPPRSSEVIGPDWRTLTGAERPVLDVGASPGYAHAERWAEALQEEEEADGKAVVRDGASDDDDDFVDAHE